MLLSVMVSRVQGGSGQKRVRTLKGSTEIQFITWAPSCDLLEHRGGQVRFCSFSSGTCSSDTRCPEEPSVRNVCFLRGGGTGIVRSFVWSVMLEQKESLIKKSQFN